MTRIGLLGTIGLTVGMGVGLAAAVPTTAHACGGTFCDGGGGGPQAMPVDQTGETIVFAIDDTHVEAHIQIEYDPTTNAERFAWLIPVMAQPEFSVGSQQLFLNLQNATVPSFGFINNFEPCGFPDDDFGGGGGGCGASTSGGGNAPGGGDEGGDDGGTSGGGVEVVQRDQVGAFDIVVVQAANADELMQWLADNDFSQDPAAIPIIEEYIEQGAMFAAARLTNGADVGEIHPITLRYEGDQPCVPIRLTRIAARDDMAIRVFFLGEGRAYPTNYRHVELNLLKLDWAALGTNYVDLVTMAIDSPMVDGHGFVTEYAGLSAVVNQDDLLGELWDQAPFVDATALEVPDLLAQQNLLGCNGSIDPCTYGHPLLSGLLAQYLPVPPGVSDNEFYSCIECYEGSVDLEAWDGFAFAADMRERIIRPGAHARDLLENNDIVTRLFTTLSPHEMTLDPTFHIEPNPTTGVDYTAATGTLTIPCGGRSTMMLPDARAREVQMPNPSTWPDIAPEQMPWAEQITEQLPGLAPVVLVDNSELIETLLTNWNETRSAPPSFVCEGEMDGPGGSAVAGDGGCGCRSTGRGPGSWMLMALALGLGGLSRRRRGA